jgi:catalase (peroxidase I)
MHRQYLMFFWNEYFVAYLNFIKIDIFAYIHFFVNSVPLGRVDSNRRDTYNTFPDPNDNIMVLLNKFGGMGLSVRDFVALSGAHTIGSQTRSTPGRFDNRHFQEILARRAPLPSDNALMDNPATRSWVQAFANSEGEFFQAFAAAMLQVANMGANFGFMG